MSKRKSKTEVNPLVAAVAEGLDEVAAAQLEVVRRNEAVEAETSRKREAEARRDLALAKANATSAMTMAESCIDGLVSDLRSRLKDRFENPTFRQMYAEQGVGYTAFIFMSEVLHQVNRMRVAYQASDLSKTE